ncbi:hypothetical protein DUNSADRAFT_16251, partial [Dunaliella salina]
VAHPPAAARAASAHGCASPYLPQPPDPTNLHSCTRSNRIHVAEALSGLRAAVQQAHVCSRSVRMARQPGYDDVPSVCPALPQGDQQPAVAAPALDAPAPSPRGARQAVPGIPPLVLRQSMPGGAPTSPGHSGPLPWAHTSSSGGGGGGIGSTGNASVGSVGMSPGSGGGWGRGASGQVGGEGGRLSGRTSGYAAVLWSSAPNSPMPGEGGGAASGGYAGGPTSVFSALGLGGDLPGKGLQRRGFLTRNV